VKIGDKVLGQDNTINTVQKLIQPISNNMCEITFAGSAPLKVTNSHPLYTLGGWKAISVEEASKEKESVPVSKLMVGDRMVREDGSSVSVTNINCWKDNIQTYNFTVDGSRT